MSKALVRASAALVALGVGATASAQTSVYDLPEKLVDSNGVDLAGGRLTISFPVVQFGDQVRLKADYYARFPEAQVLVPSAMYAFDFMTRPATGSSDGDIPTFWTPLGQAAYHNLATLETVMPDGRAFSKPAGGAFLTQFWSANWQTPGRTSLGMYDAQGNRFLVGAWIQNVNTSVVTFADGEIWTFKRQKADFPYATRLRSAISSRGYIIQFEYQREPAPTIQAEVNAWRTPIKISGGSLAHHYCDTTGTALCAAISSAGNAMTISHFATGYEATHDSGFKQRLEATGSPGEIRISSPGTNSQVSAVVYASMCDQMGIIGDVIRDGQTWHYSYDLCQEEERGISWTLTRTDPLGKTIQVRQESSYSIPVSYTDELNRVSGFGGSPTVGYAAFSYPEGNEVSNSRNSRNNIIATHLIGKNGGLISRTAGFDTDCYNLVKCNKPNWTKDENGNQTDYTYDPVHGGVLTRTEPAVNGVRPQTRYEYALKYAWLKNSGGGYSQASTGIHMLVRERFCRTTAALGQSCQGGATDEVITDFDYGPASGPNNLLLRGKAVTADGQTLRTCLSYDQMGRKISETQPKSTVGLTSCP